MNDDVEQLRERLKDAAPDQVYSALIAIGKSGARALPAQALEQDVVPYLTHDDPELRRAAIRVLGFYWKLPAFRDTASKMIDEESEPGLRSVAVMAWSKYWRDTRSPEVTQRLYALLANEGNDPMLRSAALNGMMVVAGLPSTERLLGTDTDSNDKIDWLMVGRLLEACRVAADLPSASVLSQARLGIRKIVYDWGAANNPTSHLGRLVLTINGETELVDLDQCRGEKRRAWRANLPRATWNQVVDTLNRYQFPRPVTDAEPMLPGSSSTTITWERNGETEDVVIGGRTADYSDVNRIAMSIISQMAPGVLRGKHAFPNTEVESARELHPSAMTQ